MQILEKLAKEIISNKIKDSSNLEKRKKELCMGKKIKVPANPDILKYVPKQKQTQEILAILRIKPIRSLAGICVVAVMTPPKPCPHGKCIYCPGGPDFDVPQSYTGYEPATMRGIRSGYDPYKQVQNRISQYYKTGHRPEKIELIIMGGTFPSYDYKFQENFVRRCIQGINDFDKKDSGKKTLIEVQKQNEKAKHRCIGITFETRPDYAMQEQIKNMLLFGGTRVELGVQSLYDNVLEFVERGHDVETTVKSTQFLKDSGFKINYHMMPGLPKSDSKKDFEMFKKLFTDSKFRPDMLKIYPTSVFKGTKLYSLYEQGKYKPLELDKAVKLVSKIKSIIPEYVRIMRVQRDVPSTKIDAGIKKTNLRQRVKEYMEEHNLKCRCIYCREVRDFSDISNAKIKIKKYIASKGTEFFISAETKNKLIGFCRLRFPYKPFMKQLQDSAVIRELHVYGPSLPIGSKEKAPQHKGWGKRLLIKAEEIAKENGFKKVAIISGIGVREYYRKFGYRLQGYYMVKNLN